MDIGKYIDDMHSLRAEKRYYESEIKRLDAELKLMESHIMADMIQQGLSEAKGMHAKIEYNPQVLYPQVMSWDDLHNHIREENMFGLLHKRISLTNYRDLVAAEQDPPGVVRNYVAEVTLKSI